MIVKIILIGFQAFYMHMLDDGGGFEEIKDLTDDDLEESPLKTKHWQ